MIGELTDPKRRQFISEVNTLSGLNHANLISLVGYCVEGGHCALVYPFFGGGSLHDRLFPKPSSEPGADPPPEERRCAFRPLTLQERMSIIFQVAKGLCYLHDAARPPIIHRDIKSNNILLGTGSGERLHTVVADFGLASIGERVLGSAREHVVLTSHIGGTFGYMSPEYMLKGELSDKNDVYSFGVLVLEVLTGKQVLAPAASGVGWQTLVDWVRPFLQVGDDNGPVVRKQGVELPYAILDPCLREQAVEYPIRQMVMATITLAWQCVQYDYRSRPAMRDIVQYIHNLLVEAGWQRLTAMTDVSRLVNLSELPDDE
ncbi:hypothetical protein CBR_g55054, partial [Chara braunii]